MSTSEWLWRIAWPALPVGVLSALALNLALYWFFFRSGTGEKLLARHSPTIPGKHEVLYEIRHAIIPECVLSFFTCLALNSNKPGPLSHWFSIRWNFSSADFPRIAAEIVGILVAYEAYYYTVHYLMHRRRLFPLTHSVHHRSLHPTPQAGTSVNILEAVIFYSFFASMILGPFHIVSLVVVSLEIKFASLTQHLGHEIFPRFFRRSKVLKYVNSTRFHHLHHCDNLSRNLGFQTNVLDRAFGTINKKYLDYERSA